MGSRNPLRWVAKIPLIHSKQSSKQQQNKKHESNRHTKHRELCSPRRRKVHPWSQDCYKKTVVQILGFWKKGRIVATCTPNAIGVRNSEKSQSTKKQLSPSPNERTCMGWHERNASLRWGSRGILRPEALNLEAWNFMLRDTNKKLNIMMMMMMMITIFPLLSSFVHCVVERECRL